MKKYHGFCKRFEGRPAKNACAPCLLAGLREGECLGVSWEQADFKAGRAAISRQLQKEEKKGALHSGRGKKRNTPLDLSGGVVFYLG